MKYLLLSLLLVGCDYNSWLPNKEPVWVPVICDNLICFPGIIGRAGPDFKTKEECEDYIDGKTNKDKMEFFYCQER